jgi:hypothetical protein
MFSTASYGNSITFLYVDDVRTSQEKRYPRSVTRRVLIVYRLIICTVEEIMEIVHYLYINSYISRLRFSVECPQILYLYTVTLQINLIFKHNVLQFPHTISYQHFKLYK